MIVNVRRIKTDCATIDKIQNRINVFSHPEQSEIIIDLGLVESLGDKTFLEEVLGEMIDDEYDYLLIAN